MSNSGSLSIIAHREDDWIKLVSETQNLWPPFDPCWECGTDCWSYRRLPCFCIGAISTLGHRCRFLHGRGMGAPLFLLPCYRPLVCRTNAWHSLYFLHSRWNRESRRLACRPPLGIRTSSFFGSTDEEGLHAQCQPDCQSDYVVCGSNVFRCYTYLGRALGMARWRRLEQVVFTICAVLGGRNVGEQLDESRRRLFQSPTSPRQCVSDLLDGRLLSSPRINTEPGTPS